MHARHLLSRLRRIFGSICLLGFSVFSARTLCAQSQYVNVVVLVEESTFADCGDIGSLPDIYYQITINGVPKKTPEIDFCGGALSCGIITPWGVNMQVVQRVDLPIETLPIKIEEYDADPGDDDLCDLYPGDHRRLFLDLDLRTCTISGDASGSCDQSILLSGGDHDSYFKFKIWVEEPVSYENLNVRCLHDPIWPQPGQPVTIHATALDGAANPIFQLVDNVEIMVDSRSNVVAGTATTPGAFGLNELTATVTPPNSADQIAYVCRVTDNGLSVAGPWHVAKIGSPPSGFQAVPVIQTRAPADAIDICFIPDRISYPGGGLDSTFLDDVHNTIRDVYYAADPGLQSGGLTFLQNQDKLNFWVTLRTGKAVDAASGSNHTYPSGWDTAYSFCDGGAIVHTNPLRDFAVMGDRIFSAEIGDERSFLHELGHQPFGLADEYCCDGGYFQSEHRPNLYERFSPCMADPLVGTEIPSTNLACAALTDVHGENWFRLDPSDTSSDDLMADSGAHTSRPADLRRLDYLFNKCLSAGC